MRPQRTRCRIIEPPRCSRRHSLRVETTAKKQNRAAEAHTEILARQRGTITIETSPPGATVWLDGRRLPSVSPLRTPVRLGHHFLSLRRFRYEPQIEQVLLQSGSNVKLVMTPARAGTLQNQFDATTGTRIKGGIIIEQAGSDHLRNRVCKVLGENCDPITTGIPWYLWPIAATAVTGASIAIGFAVDASPSTLRVTPCCVRQTAVYEFQRG